MCGDDALPAAASGAERGAATLAMAVAIVFLGALVSLGIAQAVLMEQKIGNNGLRAAQAFEAAEAGMLTAFDYLDAEPDRDGDGGIDPVFDTGGDSVGDSVAAGLGNGSVAVTTQDLAGGAMTRIGVTAVGYSDDRSARRAVTQTFVTLDPVPHVPRSPLVVRGGVDVHGVLAVRNPHGQDAIWSGGRVQLDESGMVSATLSAALPDTTDAAWPACLSLPSACPLGAAGGIGSTGIVDDDTTLAALTADDLFRGVFDLGPAAFAAAMVTLATTPATFARDAQLAVRDVVRVDGDAAIAGMTLGCAVVLANGATCAAAARKPAVLIVAGDAAFAGVTHVYGLVFVAGTATITGTLHGHGALVVAGDLVIDAGAELNVAFDTAVLADLRKAGPLAPLPGSWNEL